MKQAIQFPDPEKLIIKAVNAVLAKAGETGVRVAVRKLTPQEAPTGKQLTVRSDGGTVYSQLLKEESVGLNLFIRDNDRLAGYAEANRLAYLLEAILPMAAAEVPQLRQISVKSIVPMVTDTEEQHRYIRITAITSGSTIQF